ncbi:uncharacterized protein LOC143917664 [Arctopsyche grandis]|uniref:uncharacterized protein LOC143917664 n=1 Tax=Arctopsyche grandis TaxID=121162 RepID=UPI00406D665E
MNMHQLCVSGRRLWDQSVLGPPAEVEVSVKTGPPGNFNSTEGNPLLEDGNVVVVRAEEALIVIFVLLLWVAAIALFFNRWGKIRMLEPYQPKFQQQHRQSCAMVESQSILPILLRRETP